MGSIFLRASHGVRRTSATIPHPGMADTYGCPNQKFCKNKHTRVLPPTNRKPTNKTKIAKGLSCRAQAQAQQKK